MRENNTQLIESVRRAAQPVQRSFTSETDLLKRIGEARFVLIGEATHGTHEFYDVRAEITRSLITELGFNAVIVEADWPDAYRINRHVRGHDDDRDADGALGGFHRFPQWMWRNTVVLDFVEWLRDYNQSQQYIEDRCGFYGMDLYSLYTSIDAVIRFLDKIDPAAADSARQRYACFEQFNRDPQMYGYAAVSDVERSCEDEAVGELLELQRKSAEFARRDGRLAPDDYFFIEQNARLIVNAERYYRSMFHGRVSSWNLRDRHMADTVDALVQFLQRESGRCKVVLWAHNSHLGDARATDMGQIGEWNVGQLLREQHADDTFTLGFTTHEGTVTAAANWDDEGETKKVRPSLPNSYEDIFHQTGLPLFLLTLRGDQKISSLLHAPRLERAIGVIYRPESERVSHYFHASLPAQFDAVIHVDRTCALQPLEPVSIHEAPATEETYPTGF